uniref:Carboxypeptidase n=1 Tax=Ciona savignyi TaxID=51511 RepID=H2Z2J4_CIOSA
DRIIELPGVMNMPTFNMFSGYLDASDSKKLHYWLNECTNSNSNVLLVWYNGGPGCSSLDGFFVEHGPYKFNKVNGDLEENPFSWNKLAHTLYIESPAGVGFSYDSNPSHIYNDSITAQENLHALESFFIKFPTYRNKDLYLSGESYAGVYVPALASAIVQQNTWMARNLRGLLIGNGLMHFEYNQASLIYFAYYHGLFDRRSWTELHRACCPSASKRCMFNAIMESDCRVEILKVEELVWNNGINVYNLYSPCMTESQRELSKLNSFRSLFTETALEEPFLGDSILEMRKPMSERSLSLVPPCTDASVVTDYLNRADVQAALHVRETNWQICRTEKNKQIRKYKYAILIFLNNLLKQEDVRIFLYFGDVDMACNFMGGEWFVNGLGYEV